MLGRFNALADNARFPDSPAPHAWSKHDAVLRVGVGESDLERRDAFAVLKDGRVCTADGTVRANPDPNPSPNPSPNPNPNPNPNPSPNQAGWARVTRR